MLMDSKNDQMIVVYGGNKLQVLKRGNQVYIIFN